MEKSLFKIKINTRKVLLSAAGLMLSASNVLAVASNTTSTDIVGNLGIFSTVAGTLMTYSKYAAYLIAFLSLLALWISGQLAKLGHKIHASLDAKEGLKNWLIEGVLVIVCMIILFGWIIPTINSYVPSTL